MMTKIVIKNNGRFGEKLWDQRCSIACTSGACKRCERLEKDEDVTLAARQV